MLAGFPALPWGQLGAGLQGRVVFEGGSGGGLQGTQCTTSMLLKLWFQTQCFHCVPCIALSKRVVYSQRVLCCVQLVATVHRLAEQVSAQGTYLHSLRTQL